MPDVQAQLREAIEKAKEKGWSEHSLAKAAGVPSPTLNRWLSGARPDMRLSSAARLMALLGMKLTSPKIPKPPEDANPNKGPAKRQRHSNGTAKKKATPKRKRPS